MGNWLSEEVEVKAVSEVVVKKQPKTVRIATEPVVIPSTIGCRPKKIAENGDVVNGEVSASSSAVLLGSPRDYSVVSWLSCVCCCCPLSIYAIIFSRRSQAALAVGDMETAERLGQTAKSLALAAAAFGFIILLFITIALLVLM